MKRAFVVTGAPSAGHRVMAAILVRAGCWGEGSTVQPKDEEIPPNEKLLTVIRHGRGLDGTLARLKELGYATHTLVMVRDPHAHARSMRTRGHLDHLPEEARSAERQIRKEYEQIFSKIAAADADFTIVPFEALVARPFEAPAQLLQQLGLRTDNLLEQLQVNRQPAPPALADANAKHYHGAPEPPHRPEWGSELVWWPERGMGYYPVPNHLAPYDDEYFTKYERYARTSMGREITRERVSIVQGYLRNEKLIDVGIGCGAFVEAFPGASGYDVNPRAVEWLRGRNGYADPLVDPCDAMTFWDSLEHLPDPARFVCRARRFVFVSLPIFESAEHVLASKHFRPDEHFWYWTDPGIRRWFDRLGFACLEASDVEVELGREGIKTYVFKRR